MQFSLFILASKVLTVVLSTIQTKDFSKLPSTVGLVQRFPILTLCVEQLAKIKNKLISDNIFITLT